MIPTLIYPLACHKLQFTFFTIQFKSTLMPWLFTNQKRTCTLTLCNKLLFNTSYPFFTQISLEIRILNYSNYNLVNIETIWGALNGQNHISNRNKSTSYSSEIWAATAWKKKINLKLPNFFFLGKPNTTKLLWFVRKSEMNSYWHFPFPNRLKTDHWGIRRCLAAST